MADSLDGLGAVALWDQKINWRDVPGYDYEFNRKILEFTGTAQELVVITQDKPQKQTFAVSSYGKAEEFSLLEQFDTLQGRFQRTWIPSPLNFFSLDGPHGSGASALTVLFNDFEYRGFERIYIKMNDGDVITRAITGVTNDEENDETILQLATTTDRDLSPGIIEKFTLLLLARLDVDVLSLKYSSFKSSEAKLRAVELVKEYEEI